METAGYVTIAMFMSGVIFAAGRFSARIDEHERRLNTLDAALNMIHSAIRELKDLITSGAAN